MKIIVLFKGFVTAPELLCTHHEGFENMFTNIIVTIQIDDSSVTITCSPVCHANQQLSGRCEIASCVWS